jgi:hypothetical protein
LFWTRNHLDQIKVIARAHPCHYFHNVSNLDTMTLFIGHEIVRMF